ncbi:xanthine dehydrogenase family protein molybdopterin-binding subunit [Alkaliphilus peptidifermentans]|uniref:Xanthine dehydrogenase, molybdenum binding subunit apoprotein n=1 Tax=Alkaliphilus peptidifermentans DSM 18978 TaxID=1120976 RepID=A0A1G5IBM0_9FIRM|nr:xanthine dehydrogenase family protein molybdopterin-binding subunit [Alkaliphilus peptidifermentans]SCY73516.1 xanthine dehydrogenase, molybdenum binding subunit apoprotein [Alkaliphilus peptidifermentans DSM 18978]
MRYIGESINRVDGIRKVTGALKYVDDIKLSRMLYAAVKRSPYPHAKLLKVDISKAEKLPGVKAVITGKDVANRVGLYLEDKTFLATDRIRYRGEGVAAVAAESKEIALAAIGLIEVEYEELPAVTNAVEGLKKDAPLVHPDMKEYKWGPIFFPEPGTNISNHYKIRKGDVEKGFAEAEFIVENEFFVPHIQHCPIETHSVIAQRDPDESLTIWSTCQSPYAVQKALSVAFNLPLNKVRVLSPAVGGGFGGKAGTTLEGIVIPLAMKTNGRPVKLTYTREDEFINSFVRQGLHATIKTGINKNGKIVAVKNTFIWDGGAYTEYGVNIVRAGGYASTGPYDVPNVWTDSICVYTNHPVGGPYRGFGMSEIHFAIEQNIDMLAKKLDINPVEIRRINGLRPGGKNATGQVVDVCGLQDCLEDVVKKLDWENSIKQSPSKPNRVVGRGISCAYKAPSMPNNVASSAIIKINDDGTAHLMVSAQDIGQGSDTVLTQIASEVLSIPPNRITIKTGDTDHTPYEWQTVASRITYCTGNAVIKACEDAKEQLLGLAQLKLGIEKDKLYLKDGYINSDTQPQKKIAINELALGLSLEDGSGIHGPIIGRGSFIPPGVKNTDKQTGQGEKPVAFWTYGCQGVEIEVDTETGKIEVLKVASSFDVGKIINPQLIEGQIEGGIIQGLGSAIFEELIISKGVVLNPNFVDYKIPTADDMPEMIISFIENEEPTGPFGARGVGEPCMVPTAPAIANAVNDALGIRIMSLPITPEKILRALKEK